ncbi:MAG: Eco57I restriction-modification methylase domain-containing protein, partial [Spirochaetaceae bacterium]|nr:Eco57I restriction-modification methylase domain-containing protein [Spirochaetaceae bacterium]
ITVLEPTAGTGRFAEGRNNNQFTMYEVDKTSARINQLLHPQATVINESFQKQFFDSEGRAINKSYSIPQFDLVIGNPPYGDYKDKWRGLGEGKEFDRYEEYFLSRGIDSLKNQDSLMIMIVPSGFLNSNEDKVKQAISSKGKLLDAWRLPEGVFPTTKVGTDILVFQRGSCQVQELCNGNWFKNHPEKILGEVKTRTNRFGKQEEYVDFFAGHSLTDTLNLLVPDKSIDKLLETSSNFMEETLQENQQEVANAESIHQSDREREAHLRGEGVGGQPREDNGTNVPGQDPRGGGIIKEPGSPDSTVTRKPVQQPTLQHNSPAPERNDRHRSGGIGNQTGGLGGMEPHTPPLHSSLEQLSDRLTLSAQEFSQFYTGNNFSPEEYPILLATDWQGQVDSSKLTISQCEWLKSSQKYIQVEEGKFVNRNIFCSGNIYDKLEELEARKATLPAELYNSQKKALEESIPPIKSLDKVELSPLGSLAESFLVTRELTRTNYDYLSRRTIQTTSQEEIPLSESFIAWATGCYTKDAENSRRYISDWTAANISREDLPSNVSWSDIVDYIEGVSVKSSRAYTEEGKNAARIEAEEKRQARKETAEQLFNRYIRTALPE